MFLNIIPRKLKTEIIRESSLVYARHVELMAWCRARAKVLQQERLAEVTKKHLEHMTHRRSIHAVVKQKKIEEEIDENKPDQPPKGGGTTSTGETTHCSYVTTSDRSRGDETSS